MFFTTKHDKDDIVSKDTNTREGNIKENNTSRNKLAIHTREQEVQIQKVKHEPTIRNNSTMRNMVDMWDNNKLDQEKKRDSSRNILDNSTMKKGANNEKVAMNQKRKEVRNVVKMISLETN